MALSSCQKRNLWVSNNPKGTSLPWGYLYPPQCAAGQRGPARDTEEGQGWARRGSKLSNSLVRAQSMLEFLENKPDSPEVTATQCWQRGPSIPRLGFLWASSGVPVPTFTSHIHTLLWTVEWSTVLARLYLEIYGSEHPWVISPFMGSFKTQETPMFNQQSAEYYYDFTTHLSFQAWWNQPHPKPCGVMSYHYPRFADWHIRAQQEPPNLHCPASKQWK